MDHVRLDDVGRAGLDDLAEPIAREATLAGRHGQADVLGNLLERGNVFRRAGFFDPARKVGLQHAG